MGSDRPGPIGDLEPLPGPACRDLPTRLMSDDDSVTGTATDRAVQALMRGIRAGTFVPGQRLLEPELTRSLGIIAARCERLSVISRLRAWSL